jgi:hypothetical protein
MISFFGRGSYIGKSHSKHAPESSLKRVSSKIRAEEMSEYLGAKYNPVEGYENDVRIYVKPQSLEGISDGSYVDYLDGDFSHRWFRGHPGIKVIAASQHSYEVFKDSIPNEVVLIPQHHLNFERARRIRKGITVGGYTGVPSGPAFERYNDVTRRLKDIGIDFVTSFFFKTRSDALDFYKSIDILVIADWDSKNHDFRIPTKIINAGSFGIPTVASRMLGNEELEGYYVEANNMDELVAGVEKLKDEVYYNEISNKILALSENYHISKVAEYYKKLT